MIKFFRLTSILVGLALMFSFTPGPEQHIGVWKGNAGGKTMVLKFYKEGFLDFVTGGYSIDGKEYTREGKVKAQMRYSIDYSVTPIALDIIVSEIKTGKEIDRLKGIIEFKSSTKIKLALASDGGIPRPNSFKKSVLLKKI